MQKKGQVTLFIIIAVVIVALAVIGYFIFRGLPAPGVSAKLQPVSNYFRDCVDMQVKETAKVAGMQAGYLQVPEFEPGSEFMPFSSQLDFLGTGVPYWFYVSGNNIAQVQKPSKQMIEQQFASSLEESVKNCDFSSFENQGYEVNFSGEPLVSVSIKGSSIDVLVSWPMSIAFGTDKAVISEQRISSKSNFGSMYDTASSIFDSEQKTLFLENYSLDVIRLYAPVDGVELSCAPKIWNKTSVFSDMKSALEGNIAMVKAKGNYYSLGNSEHNYYVVDMGVSVNEPVYFLYMKDWPAKINVWPSEDSLMRADPIGNQQGLGILGAIGFCYVPYHFVYDLSYPVMVQVVKGDEIFQFPVVVVVDKMEPRNASEVEGANVLFDICQQRTQKASVYTYDQNSRALEADVYYKCFNQMCKIGTTSMKEGKASLEAMIPQCFNGFLVTRAQGYKDSSMQINITGPFVANVFMAPEHELALEMPGLRTDENVIITFTSKDNAFTAYYPDQKTISLAEGIYNVTVYMFKQSSITLQSQRVEKCIKVPAGGVAGMFGAMQEQCYEMDIPQESMTSVLFGGGKTQLSVTESELASASKISITATTFTVPKNLLELGDIYSTIDANEANVQLR